MAITNTETNIASANYPKIHAAYWQQLSAKAVFTGAELIKNFYQEAEKAKNKEIEIEIPNELGFWQKINNISILGEITKAKNSIIVVINNIQNVS